MLAGNAVGPNCPISSMIYPPLDRLRRHSSFSSAAGTSDMVSISQNDHKSQDDTTDLDYMKSQHACIPSGAAILKSASSPALVIALHSLRLLTRSLRCFARS